MAKQSKNSLILLLTLGIVSAISLIFLKKKKTFDSKIILRSKYAQLLPYLKAQAKLESANFLSNLFKKHNNMFGMGCVRRRPTTQIGCTEPVFDGGQKKGIYSSPQSSIEDQLLWLEYFKFPVSVDSVSEFATVMKSKGYFTAPLDQYIRALETWM